MNASQATHIAAALAALALLVAPFRSSAGLRAALFVVAALVLLFAGWRARKTLSASLFRIPPGRWLRLAVLFWVGWAVFTGIASGNFVNTLIAMRGDMLTPLLAGIVVYSVARHEADPRGLQLIFFALLTGMVILAGMAWWDPARPGIGNHEPRYVSVGWLSSWVVMLAALMPLVVAKATGRARIAWVVAFVALVVAAWFSQNRIVWLCFGAMFAVYVLREARVRGMRATTEGLLLAAGAAVAVGMFMLASQLRADQFPKAEVNAVTILKQDDRQEIWQAAARVIGQKPLLGHGYRTAAGEEALARQFSDPGFGVVFRHAHNMVLNAAIQQGLPGALALLLLFVALAVRFASATGRDSEAPEVPEARLAATCGLMLLAGVFLRNMTDDFFARHGVLLFAALVGLLLARAEPRAE